MSRSLCVRHHGAHRLLVGGVYARRPAQVTLALGGLLGEDVAQVGFAALDRTALADREALRGAALGLELRHDDSCYDMATGGCLDRQRLPDPRPLVAISRPSRIG